MYEKKIERLSQKEIVYADLSKDNELIVETAGFVPLEVKLKRFEQNGMIAQFNASEFTSSDLREMYLNPEFDITPEDDIEEVEEKLIAQRNFIINLQKKKTSEIVEDNSEVAPQGTNKKKTEQVEDTPEVE